MKRPETGIEYRVVAANNVRQPGVGGCGTAPDELMQVLRVVEAACECGSVWTARSSHDESIPGTFSSEGNEIDIICPQCGIGTPVKRV